MATRSRRHCERSEAISETEHAAGDCFASLAMTRGGRFKWVNASIRGLGQHPLGHRWRWDLVATAPGTTEVTETFDYSTAKATALITMFGFHEKNADGITSTLERLAGRFGG